MLGALSVIDSAPRRWSERDLDLLTDLAAWAVSEIELRMRSTSRPAPSPASRFRLHPVFEEIGVPMAIVSETGRFLGPISPLSI